MQFTVEPEIFEYFPGMRLAVVIAQGVDNNQTIPAVEEQWRKAWEEAGRDASSYGNAQSHLRVKPWRERMRTLGVSPKEFPSSIEAMVRRAIKGGEPFTINPLVDFYNTVSLRHTVPAGGFDLEEIRGPLELCHTRPGDTFLALDADEPAQVPPGEVAYADGPTVLTRHFVWRQARTALITERTRSVFLVSEVLGEVGETVAEAVLPDLRDGVEDYFGVQPLSFLTDAEHPTLSC